MTKSPSQQALIQFIESIIITALIAGLVSISSIVLGTGPINLQETATSFGLAVAFSLAHSLATYLKASPTPQQNGTATVDLTELGTVLDGFLSQLEQRVAPRASTVPTPQPAATQNAPTPAGASQTAQPVLSPISFDTQAMAALSVPPAPSNATANVPLQAPFVL